MGRFVFGYGSLAAELQVTPTRAFHADGFVAELTGFVRGWGVAMDNRLDLPGYKYYTAADGSRPAVFVSFLDVSPGAGVTNGLCLPVDESTLAALDRRERNYARVDVTDWVDVPGGARVWTYVGLPEARARFDGARAAGTAVIDAGYLRAVQIAFAALGPDERDACATSLEPCDLPVVELARHELS
jgi:cation transport regulator ChaC